MWRALRVAAVLLFLVAYPANAAPLAMPAAAPAIVSSAAPAPEEGLQLTLELVGAQPSEVLVRLRLGATTGVSGVAVHWDSPAGVTPVGASSASLGLAAGESVELLYTVPLGEEVCRSLAVWAQGRTADGSPVEGWAGARLTGEPGAYALEQAAEAPGGAQQAEGAPLSAVIEPGSAPDAWENDNTLESARQIPLGVKRRHTFHVPGDQDWSYFSGVAGKIYAVEIPAAGCDAQPYIWVYNSGGVWVADTHARYLTFLATYTGRYNIEVYDNDATAFGNNTYYDLIVRAYTPLKDAYEPDDTYDQARHVAVGTLYSHNFDRFTDVDWISFKAQAGKSYIIEAVSLGPHAQPYLSLTNPWGDPILVDDQQVGDLRTITWKATSNATYLVRVTPGGAAFGPGTGYKLRVRTFTPAVPDVEPDDDGYGCSLLQESWQKHSFSKPQDVDWAYFYVAPGRTYAVESWYWGKESHLQLELYRSDRTTLLASGLWLTATADLGDEGFYVKASCAEAWRFGPGTEFSLRMQQAELSEPDNERAQAGLIYLGGAPEKHRFVPAGDEDWIKFWALGARSYAFDATPKDPWSIIWCRPYMELYEEGNPAVIASSATGRLTWTAPGGYSNYCYVRVTNHAPLALGFYSNYDLKGAVFTPVPDAREPDDTFASARPAALGTWYAHNFHDAGDYDYTRFTTAANRSYIIEPKWTDASWAPVVYLHDVAPGYTTLLNGVGERLAWTAPNSGGRYVWAWNSEGSLFGPTTRYQLRIRSFTPSKDAYEGPAYAGDNYYTSARLAPNGVLLHHNFHVSSDQDWASFTATAGDWYVIETLNLACNAHTQIIVYDDTDPPTLKAQDIDSGFGDNSYLLWQAPHTGTYYVQVLHPYGRVDYGAGTRYDLQITDVTGW